MKRPFFLSSLAFAVAFVLGSVLNWYWPLPQEALNAGGPTANLLSQAAWILGIIGLIAFVVGVWNKKFE